MRLRTVIIIIDFQAWSLLPVTLCKDDGKVQGFCSGTWDDCFCPYHKWWLTLLYTCARTCTCACVCVCVWAWWGEHVPILGLLHWYLLLWWDREQTGLLLVQGFLSISQLPVQREWRRRRVCSLQDVGHRHYGSKERQGFHHADGLFFLWGIERAYGTDYLIGVWPENYR